MGATLNALLLLGWMERQDALDYLLKGCVFDPPLTEPEAEARWNEYRQRVQALPERHPQPPQRFPIPAGNRGYVTDFLRRFRRAGTDVIDVINVNPMELVAYQLYVVMDKADEHQNRPVSWARRTLVLDRPVCQLPMRIEDGAIKFSLPHGEHMFAFQNGSFQIQQGAGFVSVVDLGGGRLLLKAGYHRSFAFARAAVNEPEARDKCELVALTTSLPPQLEVAFPHQGLRTTVLGSRPPLFSDFFDVDLAMTVRLRKKKYEAHLRTIEVYDP
jgi:hypothetical protein